ncbi:transcription factor kayak-like [Gossypium australe]|uniref:Transcription factor kayak-like n=1 Tax=Gossypium australe TaxID=47621 RepID=A0A5B6UHH7_9ROSI|nr:transcription factor kayak-like [Gossypium australe]
MDSWIDHLLTEKRFNSTDDEEEDLFQLQRWDPGSLMYSGRGQNQSGISNEIILSEANGSTVQASQSPNTSNAPVLRKAYSTLSQAERAQRKRMTDQAYRGRVKLHKEQMKSNLENLTGENESLKKENQSLKAANASMNQTLTDQAKEIDQLRSDLLQLKNDHEKQNILLETLSGLLADPLKLENEKLKEENAILRKDANLNSCIPQLLEENAKLKIENKVLKVQNDALCGKIIADNDRKREQEP